ncbi:MAG: type I DNA topoisomerase [Actinomycetota bacterium]|nr:type I DNA topoisomerase [Actinomycetota bacterium]
MAKPLVIVESPAKARTIARFLGGDFVVESSVGHIRDLPRDAADVPAAYKNEPWARLGVDVDSGFKPLYVVAKEKKTVVSKLKQCLKDATELYLATDEDREGESIAWHLLEVLSPPQRLPVKRMVFHEISARAIREAVEHTRDLDRRLVDAQEARRILDRLYGYEVSPVLWKKVLPRLSAGRVQSVATRIVVERERARMRFRAANYAGLEGTFARSGERFGASVVSVDAVRVATGKDFGPDGALAGKAAGPAPRVLSRSDAENLAGALAGADFAVRSVDEKPYRRQPYPPFLTATLQQEAGRKLRFSTDRTMRVAQRLYENGYITYMRTDSTALSEGAVAAARAQAAELYGASYVPDQPRRYQKKVRNAQEAHEAIRPAGDTFRRPEQVAGELAPDELSLYDLVWKRTIASQMADARGRSMHVRLGGLSSAGEDAEFSASGRVIEFPGFLRAYVEGSDDPEAELDDLEVRLPALAVSDALDLLGLEAKEHTTQPPPRFTEASLVKALEDLGVGRPSTYASIIGTIQQRGYVWKKGSALVPSFTAFAVIGLLERHFADLVDYEFTARMEDDLDEIAAGHEESLPWLTRFYFGDGNGRDPGNGDGGDAATDADAAGLRAMVNQRLGDIDAREINSIPIGTDAEGREIVVRVGRFGPYLQRGDDTAPVPEGIAPDELDVNRALELLAKPSDDRVLGHDPVTGLPVLARSGRYGPYVQLGETDDGSKVKPLRASLLKSMSLDTITLDDALRLLSLPRSLGRDPVDGEEVTAHLGRYGPYIKKGTENRSLESEDQLFTVTLEEALALLAQPKRRAGARATPKVLRELGPDPQSGEPVVVREGRYGPYVTDGTTNASLRNGDEIDTITLERAADLLQERRDKGPAKKPRRSTAKASGKTRKK